MRRCDPTQPCVAGCSWHVPIIPPPPRLSCAAGRQASLLEQGLDEDAERDALATSLGVLTQVHERFFRVVQERGAGTQAGASPAADVRPILRNIRQAILAGTHILFSRWGG